VDYGVHFRKLIVSKKINTDKNDVSRFINSIKQKSDDISLVLEPVSQWYYYADLIEKQDVDVHLAHPMRVRAIASESALRQIKLTLPY